MNSRDLQKFAVWMTALASRLFFHSHINRTHKFCFFLRFFMAFLARQNGKSDDSSTLIGAAPTNSGSVRLSETANNDAEVDRNGDRPAPRLGRKLGRGAGPSQNEESICVCVVWAARKQSSSLPSRHKLLYQNNQCCRLLWALILQHC